MKYILLHKRYIAIFLPFHYLLFCKHAGHDSLNKFYSPTNELQPKVWKENKTILEGKL